MVCKHETRKRLVLQEHTRYCPATPRIVSPGYITAHHRASLVEHMPAAAGGNEGRHRHSPGKGHSSSQLMAQPRLACIPRNTTPTNAGLRHLCTYQQHQEAMQADTGFHPPTPQERATCPTSPTSHAEGTNTTGTHHILHSRTQNQR